MTTFVFPKYPDTELAPLQHRIESLLVYAFLQFPPSIDGRLTFEREPPRRKQQQRGRDTEGHTSAQLASASSHLSPLEALDSSPAR